MILKLIISYNGTNYSGWQVQNSKDKIKQKRTIQEAVERALYKVYKKRIKVDCASRTDSGVHAKAQVASYPKPLDIPIKNLPIALNKYLPPSIRILDAQEKKSTFNARKSAKSKIYRYQIYNGKILSPFDEPFCYFIPFDLDLKRMKKSAKEFLGEHNFQGFTTSQEQRNEMKTIIYDLNIEKKKDMIYITIHGRNFLHKMVRFMTGALVESARGALDFNDIKESLTQKRRIKPIKVAPSKGLFLEKVKF